METLLTTTQGILKKKSEEHIPLMMKCKRKLGTTHGKLKCIINLFEIVRLGVKSENFGEKEGDLGLKL